MNEDLNTAFVDCELNKTVNNGGEGNNWNLLDDPNILKEEENDVLGSNILDFHEKDANSNFRKHLPIMESSIRFAEKSELHFGNHKHTVEEDDDEEDLKDLCNELNKKWKPTPKKK